MAPAGHAAPVRVIGAYLSPYVRKVLAVLELKGLRYEIDPIVPYMGDDRFTALSPLRRVPVLIDDQVTLADSTVICQYLEDRYPEPAFYPADIADRARARWLEEYSDSRMGDVLIWGLFDHAVISPAVWGTPRDRAAIDRIVNEEVPIISSRSCRARASCSVRPALQTSRLPRFCATQPSRVTPWTRSAGRAPRASWTARLRSTAWRNFSRMRRSCFGRPSASSAPHSRRREHRSPARPWAGTCRDEA